MPADRLCFPASDRLVMRRYSALFPSTDFAKHSRGSHTTTRNSRDLEYRFLTFGIVAFVGLLGFSGQVSGLTTTDDLELIEGWVA